MCENLDQIAGASWGRSGMENSTKLNENLNFRHSKTPMTYVSAARRLQESSFKYFGNASLLRAASPKPSPWLISEKQWVSCLNTIRCSEKTSMLNPMLPSKGKTDPILDRLSRVPLHINGCKTFESIQTLGRNSRPPKRANKGARPCSSVNRRKRRRVRYWQKSLTR